MKSKEEDMSTPEVWRSFYCRYKEESRQRGESRLNMARRLNSTMRGERGRRARERLPTKAVQAKRPE